jgi:hypothetical protein
MINKVLGILKSPYPAGSSPVAVIFYSIGSGLFVTLFFAAFEPFGFFLIPRTPRWTLYIGYGAVTGAAIILNNLLLRLWPRFFKEENWSLGRQILCMGWVTLVIGWGCYLLSGAVCVHFGLPAQCVRLRTIVIDTFIIAFFPITIINLVNYALADLLFIQAEENYVQIYHKSEKPGRVLLRSSLTRIERQLRPFYPRLFRCHRTCIVNSSQIVKVAGNAQGLKLTLRDTAATIPVARRYVDEFRQQVIRDL